MLTRAVAVGLGLVLVASGCSGERSSDDQPAVSGVEPEATATTAPTVSRTTSATTPAPSTSTQPEDRPDPAAPSADPVEAEDPPPVAPLVPDPIGWEDLEHLTVEIDGEVVRLEGGRATVSYGGASATMFTLQNRVAQGDLDGDGDEDVVAHIIERSPGTGVFHLVVPVLDDGGTAVALSPVFVGDRIVMDAITVRDGLIEVSLFDRAEDEPFTIISRHTTLEIDPSAPSLLATVIGTEPIEDMPIPGPERPEVNIRFEPGAVGATESGTIDFRERQTYTVYASEGQPFTATLRAPLGVWLDVRLDHLVVNSAARRSQLVEAELPATGPWKVTVVSSHAGESGYELTVEVLPLGGADPASTTTTEAVTVPRPVTPDDDGDVVYLTFDDGPHPDYTPQMLDVLARHDARATFFVVGSLAQAYPDIIQRIAAEGHTIANHTWKHEDLAGLSRAAFDETISRTQMVLGDLATPCLRPPYGSIDAFTREWASDHGLSLLTWDASPSDWLRPPAEEIADYIVQLARPGVVLLMHDGGGDRSATVQGLDMALERLADRGLRYEPVCR